jgi:hypothetical protein
MTKAPEWQQAPAIVTAIAKIAELHGRLVRLRVRRHEVAARNVLALARGNLK